MTTLVLDTGPILAALNQRDPDHERCVSLFHGDASLLVLSTVLVEVDYWLRKLNALATWADFVADIAHGAFQLLPLSEADLRRAAELELRYDDLRLGLVDASVIAVCERLGETKVATLDHRHFAVVKPAHCERLELLP